MGITEAGIRSLGFTEIPKDTKIKAFFNSIFIYNIEGIRLKDSKPKSIADIGFMGNEYSFALGHNSSKTTEIYTHVSKKAIDKIRNPVDDFFN